MPTVDLGDLSLKFQFFGAISSFMSSLNFMLSRFEHEKSFIASGPDYKKEYLYLMIIDIFF